MPLQSTDKYANYHRYSFKVYGNIPYKTVNVAKYNQI
jgi:hypothetical protein